MSQLASQSAAATRNDTSILRASSLRKTFRMGDSEIEVLKGVDLVVRTGEFVAIEGRSGSGKSTLLHLLGALDTPDAGRIDFEGNEYVRDSRSAAARIWRSAQVDPVVLLSAAAAAIVGEAFIFRFLFSFATIWFLQLPLGLLVVAVAGVVTLLRGFADDRLRSRLRLNCFGFVFQFYHLLPELNVLENTILSAMIEHSWLGFQRRRAEIRHRGTDVLEQLGMAHRLKHKPNQLSGGERQRVAIARALMNNPKVLFADEPTGNLDAETGRQIMTVLEKLHKERNQTIVMVTHDRTIAKQADRILVLRDGKLERAENS